MQTALALARRGLGNTAPNPAVGCVIVRDGTVVGRGWTAPGGRPHAEAAALAAAGERAKGATVYTTLEPCAHVGKSPACAAALADAGVARVVYSVEDPDPRVQGAGAKMLRDRRISVESGLLGQDAARLNAGFFHTVRHKRPLVTLKFATSSDGRIPTPDAPSPWVTGIPARDRGHVLRANHDAILVGIGTVLADDPSLTCRLAGMVRRSPIRIVLDSDFRTPEASKLLQTAAVVPTWLVGSGQSPRQGDVSGGLRHIPVADTRDIPAILSRLAEEGITRLLVEGGPTVHQSFARSGLVDEIYWFRAKAEYGTGGRPALGDRVPGEYIEPVRFELMGRELLGDDILEIYAAKE